MGLTLRQIILLLNRQARPEEHVVFVDGERRGRCTRASLRPVLSLRGFEIVLDYAFVDGSDTTALSTRLRGQGVGEGGREQILVNGQDVSNDDVLLGGDDSTGAPSLYVEFKFTQDGQDRRIKFAAPLTAFD